MQNNPILGALSALFLVAACTEAPNAPGGPSQAQAPSADSALVGVWAGAITYNGNQIPYHFVLQPDGVAYFLGGHPGTWRVDGQRVLLGSEYDGQMATFGGIVERDRIVGELPMDGEDIPFTVERVGLWASVGAPHASAGVWRAQFEEDGDQFACGLIVQPDGMAFLSCEGAQLARGSWRSQGDVLQISLTMARSSGEEISFEISGSPAGDTMAGSFDRGGDGDTDGAFTATRAP